MRILLSFILFFLLFHNLAYAQVAGTPPVFACSASQWIDELKGSNNPVCTQPAFTDLSGSLADTQCPDASASVEGCVTIGTQTFAGEKTIQDPFHFLSYYELGEIAEPTTPSADIARVYVADENGKTRLFLKTPDGSVIQINQDSYIVGTNRSGATANPGEVFYIDGSTGQVADFKKAKADSATTMPAVAMALDTILDTNTGRFMTFGVGRDLDTNAFTEADKLYVSAATAGALTTTIPTHPNLEQRVGVVIRKHPSLGSIAVFFGATRGAEDGTNQSSFVIGTSEATSVVLQSNSTGTQKTANLPDATGEVSLLGQLISFITPAEIADECAGLEALRRNAGDSAWECFTPGGGGDSITVNTTEATDANFLDNIYIAYAINTASSPDDITSKFVYNAASGDHGLLANESAFAANGFVFEGATANTIETYLQVTDPTVSDKTFTIPNGDSVAVIADAGAANNFLTAISTGGVISKAQPTISNIVSFNYVASVATTTPLSGGAAGSSGAILTLSIADAVANASTKGAATFATNDFDSSTGLISLDYTNGQAATGSVKGFLTSADWTTFNNKVATTRTISTSTGLTGGGDLSANRTLLFNYANTLAGNPTFNAKECVFVTEGTSGGGFLCEGSAGGNTNEQLYLFPAVDGADTTNYIPVNAAQVTSVDGRSLTVNAGVLDADAELYTDRKCANIDPAATTTDWFIYKMPFAGTATEIGCIVDAATSVVLTFRECDANGGTCGNTGSAITCATTWTTQTITDSALDDNDILRITRGTVTGSPTQAFACIKFTAND
jgi:hypothetical protein